jgi:putative phosphoribosyl transferase
MAKSEVTIETATARLRAQLTLPDGAFGVVVLAHAAHECGPALDARLVASLSRVGLACLTVDLTIGISHARHENEAARRHEIHVLGQRLLATTRWLRRNRSTSALPVAFFATGLGASAACAAAVASQGDATCIVAWDGRIDLVGHDLLNRLRAPILLMVSDENRDLLAWTRWSCAHIGVEHHVQAVPGQSPLEADDDTLSQVERHALIWLRECMRGAYGPSATLAGSPHL